MSKDNYVDFVHLSLPVRAWDDVQKRITALEDWAGRGGWGSDWEEPAEPDRCIVCDCILTSYEGDVCRSHEPAKPAMEEWIEVDGKMYGTSAAPDHIEDDLVEELRNRIEAQDTIISAMTHRLRFMENL